MPTPPARDRYDAVIVGGGHNGLVAAAYLAGAGLRALVLERNHHVGGAAGAVEPFAGLPVTVSPHAHEIAMFPTQILKDLELDLPLRPRPLRSVTPVYRHKQHRSLLVENSPGARTAESFREFTGLDREYMAFSGLQEEMHDLARALAPTLLEPLRKEHQAQQLIAPETWEKFFYEPVGYTLEQRFKDDVVHGMVASSALLGGFADLYESSLRANVAFLYHQLAVQCGPAMIPVGGMGSVTAALERAVWQAGGEIVTEAFVTAIESDGVTARVHYKLDDLERAVETTWALGNVAPWVLRILLGEDPGPRPEGAHVQATMLLDRLPRLAGSLSSADAFGGTMHLGSGFQQLMETTREVAEGSLPEMPPMRVSCNTLSDPSVLSTTAVDGKHLLTFQAFQTPARLFVGDVDHQRDEVVSRMLDAINVHLDEAIESLITIDRDGKHCIEALAPQDVENQLAMPGGHWFHGSLSWPWAPAGAALETPAQRWGVATPWPKVLLCGSGAKRGFGVSGVGGHNAAMAVLEATRRGRNFE